MTALRLRRLLAAVGFVVLFGALVAPLPVRELTTRASRALGGGAQAPSWFDPGYQAFLEEIARATPPDSTVALVVPTGELYVYRAAYQLAPRRVVFGRDAAKIVAFYGESARDGSCRPIPHGALCGR